MTLALSLLLFAAPPADCAVDDHACKAERFAVLAAQTTDPILRAQRLYAAHRSFLFLHQKTGSPAALCQARTLLEQVLAIQPRPEALTAPLRKAEDDLREREATTQIDCTPISRPAPRKKPSPRVPSTPAPTFAQPPSEPLLLDPPPAVIEGDLLPVNAPPPTPSAARPAPPSLPAARPPVSRARLGSGLGLLLASAALAAGMGVSLDQRAAVLANFRALEARIDTAGRDATPDEYALADAANQRYGRLTLLAGITGAAATTSLLTGIILLATPPRRARLLAFPWSTPRAAGLSLHARF